jgi:upstream activation factor subunit UAF30
MAKAAEKKAGGKKMDGLQKPLQPSPELGEIVGTEQLSRADVVSKVWEYIKKNNLQNPENKREIVADEKLEKIFGRPKVTMFEMNKYLSAHLKG